MKLLSPDDGAPAGGGNVWEGHEAPAPETPAAATEPAAETPPSPPAETTPGASAPAPAQPAPSPPQSDWTPERVAEMLRAAREPAAGQPPQMSEEEMNRLLNVATVTQEDVAGILEGGENAVAAMQRLIQAAVLQARTTAWYQTQMLLRQQQESLSPVISHYQQAQQEKLTQQFFAAHKEFEPAKHTKLLAAVKTSLDAEQAFNGKTQAQGFALIAERAKEVLTASGTPLVPVGAPPQSGGAPKMAQLSRGAGHGAAAETAVGAPSNTAKRFFG